MIDIADMVNDIVEQKTNSTHYCYSDENVCIGLLNRISTSEDFKLQYRKLVRNWISEIEKPSRRFKKVQHTDLIPIDENQAEDNQFDPALISSNRGTQNLSLKQLKQNQRKVKVREPIIRTYRIKLPFHPRKLGEEADRRICFVCERRNCTYFCKGFCKRQFHQFCKNCFCQKSSSNELINVKIQEDFMPGNKLWEFEASLEERKNRSNVNYVCDDCQNCLVTCSICHEKGKFYRFFQSWQKQNVKGEDKDKKVTRRHAARNEPGQNQSSDSMDDGRSEDNKWNENEYDSESNDQKGNYNVKQSKEELKRKVIQELQKYLNPVQKSFGILPRKKSWNLIQFLANELIKCSYNNCYRYYHLKCVEKHPNTSFEFEETQPMFLCPYHRCHECNKSFQVTKRSLLECFRCCRAIHFKCLKANQKKRVQKITQKLCICDQCNKDKLAQMSISFRFPHLNNEKEIIRRVKPNSSQTNLAQWISEIQSKDEGMSKLIASLGITENLQKQLANAKIQQLTYEDLGIPPIEGFDYSQYKGVYLQIKYIAFRIGAGIVEPDLPHPLQKVHGGQERSVQSIIANGFKEMQLTLVKIQTSLRLLFEKIYLANYNIFKG